MVLRRTPSRTASTEHLKRSHQQTIAYATDPNCRDQHTEQINTHPMPCRSILTDRIQIAIRTHQQTLAIHSKTSVELPTITEIVAAQLRKLR